MRFGVKSGPVDNEPLGSRLPGRPWRAVAGLLVAVAAVFALLAWQQGGDGDSGGPLNAIAAAAERTQREPGGRATMRTVVSRPARSESLTITGHMVFDDETERSRGILTMPSPESDGSVEMEVVSDGTAMYMRSSLFGPLPGGREWMAFDLSLGEGPETPLPANGVAKAELELLEAASGDVRKLGREDVRGVPTTRYRGTVGASDDEGTPLQVEAWIDAHGLVRRMRFVKSEPLGEGEGSETIDMRMDFFDFGSVPEIDVPESSEVFDATSVVEDDLDQ